MVEAIRILQAKMWLVLMIKLNVIFFQENYVAETSDEVITCTILVCNQMANMLFDPGSTYSYIFMICASEFEILCDVLGTRIRVSTPV